MKNLKQTIAIAALLLSNLACKEEMIQPQTSTAPTKAMIVQPEKELTKEEKIVAKYYEELPKE
ncbi:MAG: hypothetical protein ACOVO2_08625 [Emticicia sp.]|uniref:hypothetical protein n=1 Tax=Emticicia sp. TaxID=1930953 RepID=UPI003BA498DA